MQRTTHRDAELIHPPTPQVTDGRWGPWGVPGGLGSFPVLRVTAGRPRGGVQPG